MMKLLLNLPSILGVSLVILFGGLRDSFATVGSALRDFPAIMKSEILASYRSDIATKEVVDDFEDSRDEQAIYGYSA